MLTAIGAAGGGKEEAGQGTKSGALTRKTAPAGTRGRGSGGAITWLGTRGADAAHQAHECRHPGHLGLCSCSHHSGHYDSRAGESPWTQAYRRGWTSVGPIVELWRTEHAGVDEARPAGD